MVRRVTSLRLCCYTWAGRVEMFPLGKQHPRISLTVQHKVLFPFVFAVAINGIVVLWKKCCDIGIVWNKVGLRQDQLKINWIQCQLQASHACAAYEQNITLVITLTEKFHCSLSFDPYSGGKAAPDRHRNPAFLVVPLNNKGLLCQCLFVCSPCFMPISFFHRRENKVPREAGLQGGSMAEPCKTSQKVTRCQRQRGPFTVPAADWSASLQSLRIWLRDLLWHSVIPYLHSIKSAGNRQGGWVRFLAGNADTHFGLVFCWEKWMRSQEY